MYTLNKLFKGNSNYNASVFDAETVNAVENLIYIKNVKGAEVPYIKCQIRDKEIKLTPEEAVRQLYIYKLIHEYGYDKSQIELERAIHFGHEIKRADIVIFDKSHPNAEYIIVELKKPKLSDGKEQLKSYCNATGATMGVWTNGQSISHYHRKDPNYFEDIPNIPRSNQTLLDITNKQWYIDDLVKNDKLINERKSLKSLILEMEDEVLAGAGVNVFEEVFKLIYTKLYDEMQSRRNKKRALEFRNYSSIDGDEKADLNLKNNIQNLFSKAKEQWPGVFDEKAVISLTPSHLSVCVSSLQDVKLFNSNLDVIDDAFEYLMSKNMKGEKGQFFTPRYVIDMCVKMLNPDKDEKMIDTAAGSCGFPVHTIFYVWKKILAENGIKQSHLFTAEKKPSECEDYVNNNVFAIDFDEQAVRVARTLNLIAGDGWTNVIHLNTIDYNSWDVIIKNDENWQNAYFDGWKKLRKMRANTGDNSAFNFDIVMANPPFAGDIKESKIITKYELGKNAKGKYQSKVGRDILFIERNLNFLKPGGRMAIVLPQGRFNNSSDKYIRDFIAERCRILAVVGLHGNVFKPHTGTKTSVLFVQKWDDELCPKPETGDYPIFFATMRKPSKDNSGDKIFRTDENGEIILDEHGHMIVDHDLYNHDGLTEDGIAEAFIEFAKREKLSFFKSSPSVEPFNDEKYRALMDGLECSEVMLSEILKENKKFRFDAEYFSKTALYINNFIKKKSHYFIKMKEVVSGPFGSTLKSSSYMTKGDIAFIRIENIKSGFHINYDNLVYISQKDNMRLYNSQLYTDDIILSKVGGIGFFARVDDEIKTCNISENNIGIKLFNYKRYVKHTILVYLNSKYGQILVQRRKSGNVQPKLNVDDICFIPIPKFSDDFCMKISSLIDESEEMIQTSRYVYNNAQVQLLSALNFDTLKISSQNTVVKTFSQSFALTGRLDAEYYQPKYEELYNLLGKLETLKLGELVNIKKSIEPGSEYYGDYGLPFIRVSDVNKTGINTPSIKIPTNIVTNIENLYPEKDTILLSKDGSVGIAYKIEKNLKAVTSGALLHLNVKNKSEISPDYLTLVLNSDIVQLQAERDVSGAIIQHWRLCDIENVVIPILPHATQLEIADKVQNSFNLRRQAEKLIDTAVKAVEIAIEQDEHAAELYIIEAAQPPFEFNVK